MRRMIQMSEQEIARLQVLRDVHNKRITQAEAGERLELSTRQVRRLLRRYRQEGAKGIISRRRGKPGNHRIADARKQQIVSLIGEHYSDCGPTFTTEKLRDLHSIKISKETVRRWMTEQDWWHPKRHKQKRVHQMRTRRSRFGELIQIDASEHDWFLGRREKCALIVFIDDATGSYMELLFAEAETTQAYMQATREYLHEYGVPRAFYSDRHSIFRVNKSDADKGKTLTQFGRAMKTLDVELINANTPQAKGRVERANGVLQDRLVKELKIRNINTIEEANKFLKHYKDMLSNMFAVEAASSENAHRKVRHSEEELDLIFSTHSTRIISKNLEVRYENALYQLNIEGAGLTMRGAPITVCKDAAGVVTLLYKGKSIPYTIHTVAKKQLSPQDAKTLNREVDALIVEQDARLGYTYPVDAFSCGYEPIETEEYEE